MTDQEMEYRIAVADAVKENAGQISGLILLVKEEMDKRNNEHIKDDIKTYLYDRMIQILEEGGVNND